MCVCVCVVVCVVVCVCVCVCVWLCVCVRMYNTDQCCTHLNSLWLLRVFGGGVFPYLASSGLFWWDCALRVYRISYLG